MDMEWVWDWGDRDLGYGLGIVGYVNGVGEEGRGI